MASKASASSATPAVFWPNVFEPVAVRKACAAREDLHDARRDHGPGALPRHADGEVPVARVAVVAGGERGAEAVVRLGAVPDASRVLRPQLAAGRGEAGRRSRGSHGRRRSAGSMPLSPGAPTARSRKLSPPKSPTAKA